MAVSVSKVTTGYILDSNQRGEVEASNINTVVPRKTSPGIAIFAIIPVLWGFPVFVPCAFCDSVPRFVFLQEKISLSNDILPFK